MYRAIRSRSEASDAAGPQMTISVCSAKRRCEEHQALDVIQVQMGQEYVDAKGSLRAARGQGS